MEYSTIRRWLVWAARVGRCRGFGVQSPWAYRMVRYVISEHWPYYAYAPLAARFPGNGVTRRRICELCLRLANHLQPQRAAGVGVDGDDIGCYIQAGCRHAEYANGIGDGTSLPAFAVIAPCREAEEAFRAMCAARRDGTAVMLLDIRRDAAMRRLWREAVQGVQGVVTFDLYYCGLVFFDRERYKQNYIINF